MTHQNNYTFTNNLAEKGLEAIPELLRILINYAMLMKRINKSICGPTRIAGFFPNEAPCLILIYALMM